MSTAVVTPRAFFCNVKGKDWGDTVYALTRSKARYRYWLRVREPYPDLRITAVEVWAYRHNLGDFQPLRLRRTALQRGLEFVRAGMAIEVDGQRGVIVNGNDSANFDVMFTEGKYQGQIGNCHPTWKTRYFDEQGKVIAEFL